MKKLMVAVALLFLNSCGDPNENVQEEQQALISCQQLRNLCSGLCHSDTTCYGQCYCGHGCGC